jgi:hypothetical protein
MTMRDQNVVTSMSGVYHMPTSDKSNDASTYEVGREALS